MKRECVTVEKTTTIKIFARGKILKLKIEISITNSKQNFVSSTVTYVPQLCCVDAKITPLRSRARI
jgi:hypothetical protein